jgi:hypothetical protein
MWLVVIKSKIQYKIYKVSMRKYEKNYWFGNYLNYPTHILNEKIGKEVKVHVRNKVLYNKQTKVWRSEDYFPEKRHNAFWGKTSRNLSLWVKWQGYVILSNKIRFTWSWTLYSIPIVLPIYQLAIVRTIQFQWREETYVDHCEPVQHKPLVTLLATTS